MFDSLSDRLHAVLKRLRGESRLSESNISEAMREIRVALLEADVNLEVASQFVSQVSADYRHGPLHEYLYRISGDDSGFYFLRKIL